MEEEILAIETTVSVIEFVNRRRKLRIGQSDNLELLFSTEEVNEIGSKLSTS
jgi:hypothetical protein